MSELVIQRPEQVAVPVRGQVGRFPVRRIYCVGRNYADHAIEMGHDPSREPPFFFLKPADCIRLPGQEFHYPSMSSDVHFEYEQVAALGCGGRDIAASDALSCVWGYATALDMTRRDLQAEAKALRRPWDTGKAFDGSVPISDIVPVAEIGHPSAGRVHLRVNGETRQDGDLNQMIWKTADIIAYLSSLFELFPGDLILTGTPAGVGPVNKGDYLEGSIEGIGDLSVKVV